MNQKDKELLNILQFDFLISERPYREIGQKLNLSENQVIEKVKSLKKHNFIRRIGAVFESDQVQHTSALVAAKVREDKTDKIKTLFSKYHQITHAYLRSHEYNLWFTLTAASQDEILRLAEEIKQSAGLTALHVLPALKKFKIDTRFKL